LISLDARDLRILAELVEKSNASFVEIGRKLDLHPNVIAYRVNKMEQAGIIKRYTTVLDLGKLGLSEHMYVGVSFAEHGTRDDVFKRIAGISQVTELVSSLGSPEGVVFLVGRNKEEIDMVLSRMRELNVKIDFTVPVVKTYQDGLMSRLLREQAERVE